MEKAPSKSPSRQCKGRSNEYPPSLNPVKNVGRRGRNAEHVAIMQGKAAYRHSTSPRESLEIENDELTFLFLSNINSGVQKRNCATKERREAEVSWSIRNVNKIEQRSEDVEQVSDRKSRGRIAGNSKVSCGFAAAREWVKGRHETVEVDNVPR